MTKNNKRSLSNKTFPIAYNIISKSSITYSLLESDRYQTTNSRSPKTSPQNL
ncbi:MAG: hypothetical protein ACKPCM_15075 [Pseudanabaena sp.]